MREKIMLSKSSEYGCIASEVLREKMQHNHPFFIVPWAGLVTDHLQMEKVHRKSSFLSEYYIFATFMPPGETKTLVSFGDTMDKSTYHLNTSVVPIRKEEVSLQSQL